MRKRRQEKARIVPMFVLGPWLLLNIELCDSVFAVEKW